MKRVALELIWLRRFRIPFFARKEARHGVAMMRGFLIRQLFHMLCARSAEYDRPGQHLGIADLIELFRR